MSGKKLGDSGGVRFGDIVKLKKDQKSHSIHRINANKDDLFWFKYIMEYSTGDWGWYSITRKSPCGKIEGFETTGSKQEIDDIEFIE